MKNQNHKKRTVLLLSLLAALCIGAAELFACNRFDPPRYEAIVSPVRRSACDAAAFCAENARQAGEAVRQAAEDQALYTAQAAQQLEQTVQHSRRELERIWTEYTSPPPKPSPLPGESSPQPEESELPASAPAEAPVTELRTEKGRDILTGGAVDVVYFNQAEEPWADAPYGTDTLHKYGCGPTVMAMAVASLTEEATDPARMAQWAAEHGHWASRSGSYHSIVPGAAAAFGLTVESPVEQTPDALRDILGEGKLLAALVGPGHFTKYGHFILLRGITPNGDILVADPNSIPNSLAAWDPQLILDELAGTDSSGAPLWALSVPAA